MYRYLIIIALLTTLTACNQNSKQPLEGQPISDNPLLNLSTTNDNADPTEEKPEVTTIDKDATVAPGYGVPQEEPSEQKEVQPDNKIIKIPFTEFQSRWNAVTDEQASNLYIASFEKVDDNIYSTTLKDDIELLVYVKEEKAESIMLRTVIDSSGEILDMLTAWSQIVYLFESEISPHQIDELFNELGVGPNLDIKDVKQKSVIRGGIQYTVNPITDGFELEATYK